MTVPGPARGDEHVWDEWYGSESRWSGRPNGVLVDEVPGLVPATALDVGCGEGADAIWLARRGWKVTAIDPSLVALDRARAAAGADSERIDWVRAGVLDLPLVTGQHDLVIAMYAVLPRTDDDAAIIALLGAVAPGGTLLVVHHESFAASTSHHGHDPSDHVTPDDVAASLDEGWDIQHHEARAPAASGAGRPDVRDVILRARRRTD